MKVLKIVGEIFCWIFIITIGIFLGICDYAKSK